MDILRRQFKSEKDLSKFFVKRYKGIRHYKNLKTIVTVGYLNGLLIPSKKISACESVDGYLDWLVEKYENGLSNKTINKKAEEMATNTDPMVEHILMERLSLKKREASVIISHHRQAMSAENIIGSLLEEYIDEILSGTSWVCCYGSVLRSVDFCHPFGGLVQIKNRSNTENSSSRIIREGKNIRKWHRVEAYSKKENWEELCGVFKIRKSGIQFGERGFREFVTKVIRKNPGCISPSG